MKLTKIFEPITISKTEFKNRMVVSAMVTNYCNEDGTPTEKFMAYHEHKAKGGYGIIITEDFAVTRTAGIWHCCTEGTQGRSGSRKQGRCDWRRTCRSRDSGLSGRAWYLSETVMSVPRMDTGEFGKAMKQGFVYDETGS